MSEPPHDITPGPEEGEPSGLPPELEEVLRGLTGGAPIDPELASMLQGMGIDQIDPKMLAMVAGQVQAMFASAPEDGSVDKAVATDVARKAVGSAGDPIVSSGDANDVAQAVVVASLWLDEVTDVAAATLRGTAWSRAEWVEAAMPVWCQVVEPVAEGVADAVGSAMAQQMGQLGEQGLPEGLVPPGTNPAAMLDQMGSMMRRVHGSLFSVQLGQAVGALAGDITTGCEVGLPLVAAPDVVLMPVAVRSLAEGLGIDEPQVLLYLAVRESARTRLFAAVPWLGPQLLAAVRDYADGISIDTAAIEEGLRSIDPSDPGAVQSALEGKLFAAQHSPVQAAALTRLETSLALVEGWVDVVTARAVSAHLPEADALGEAVRRRRAAGGPSEKTFAALVGLELRPRRLRDAANLFAALESRGGAAARDAAWAHPDLAPRAGDLDDPLGYVERSASPVADSLDAELSALLGDAAGPTTDEDGDGPGEAPAAGG